MDPYQSTTGGLLDLLADYGTSATSTDLLNLLAGWPGPGSPNPSGPVQNPNYNPSTQPDNTYSPSTGGGTPPPPPVGGPGSQQQQTSFSPAPTTGTPPPNTPGNAPTPGTQGQQQQQQQTGLMSNPMQIVGIVLVLVAVFFVVRKKR